jgi:hypothetical protein
VVEIAHRRKQQGRDHCGLGLLVDEVELSIYKRGSEEGGIVSRAVDIQEG